MIELCKISDLFDIEYPKTAIASEQEEGPIPFVSSCGRKNGISKFVKKNDKLKLYSSWCITVPLKGTVLHAFLQSEVFYCAHQIAILAPKIKMSKEEMFFYCICIRKNKFKFSYGRQADRTFKDLLIPAKIPDWVYKVETPKLGYGLNPSSKELKVETWKEFEISNLFDLENGKGTPTKDNGLFPIVTSTTENNGIDGHTSETYNIVNAPAITISIRGGGNAFYQDKDFSPSLNALTLKPKFSLNKQVGLFLCVILNQSCFKYSYGRIRTMGRVLEEKIKLPTTPEGTPDWGFMEEYIKRISGSASL